MGWNTAKTLWELQSHGTSRAAAWAGAAGPAWDALEWKISCTVALPTQPGEVTATQNEAEHDGFLQAGEHSAVIQLLRAHHNNSLGNGWLGSGMRNWKGWNHNQKAVKNGGIHTGIAD